MAAAARHCANSSTSRSCSRTYCEWHSQCSPARYSADELFDIVADVDRYREFLPYCVDSRVLGPSLRPSRPREADGATYIVDAELTIGFAAIRESYVSEVRYRDGEWVKVCAPPCLRTR